MASKRLYRSEDAVFGGVCAGIADYFDVSPFLIRVLALVLLVAFAGAPFLVYVTLWGLIPKRPTNYKEYVDVTPDASAAQSHDASRRGRYGAGRGASDAAAGVPGKRLRYSRLARLGIIAGITASLMAVFALLAYLTGIAALLWALPVLVVSFGAAVVALASPAEQGRAGAVAQTADGVLFIVLGAVLLACCLRVLPWAVISFVVAIWPLFIIALGVALTAIALKSAVMHVLAASLAIGATAVGVCNCQMDTDLLVGCIDGRNLALQAKASAAGIASSAVNLDEESPSNLELNTGRSTFTLTSGAGTQARLFTASGRSASSAVRYSAGSGTLVVDADDGLFSEPCSLELPAQTSLDTIEARCGGSRLDMDLTGLCVRHLNLGSGASDLVLTLGQPAFGGSTVQIASGLSKVTILVPRGTYVCVHANASAHVSTSTGFDTVTSGNGIECLSMGALAAAHTGRDVWNVTVTGDWASIELRYVS